MSGKFICSLPCLLTTSCMEGLYMNLLQTKARNGDANMNGSSHPYLFIPIQKKEGSCIFFELSISMHACMHEIPLDPVPKIRLHGRKFGLTIARFTHHSSITFTQELISSDTVSHIKDPNVTKAASCIFLIHL